MNSESVKTLADVFLAASLPVDPDDMERSAERALRFYESAPAGIVLPPEEVADRFSELWKLWFFGFGAPSKELKDVIQVAVSVDEEMESLAACFFKLIAKLEKKIFMSREHAVALVGCAPLIRTLVVEQHLGLDRIKAIINIPGATYDAIKGVLAAMNVGATFDVNNVALLHDSDVRDVASYFGDTLPDDADVSLRNLLGSFSRSEELWENVTELVYIGFDPYLFMLYYELLTLETTDRFPGKAIYEHGPRSSKVKQLWNSMYNSTQENPYLNNAKSVYSLDLSWAETKLSRETQNGSLLLAGAFDILAELPYSTRRRVARIVRCYLVLMASKNQSATPLNTPTDDNIRNFVECVAASNSMTKGVLDQRLVDFLVMCAYDHGQWAVRGLGSSVNETNASGRKYGDVELFNVNDRLTMKAYEAHGGGLRDEYVADHIRSLDGTVRFHLEEAEEHGETYSREVEVIYVAHDVSRLSEYRNGHTENIRGISFTFRFVTFKDFVEEAGGIDYVIRQIGFFKELVHERISRLPDSYTLKQKYRSILE